MWGHYSSCIVLVLILLFGSLVLVSSIQTVEAFKSQGTALPEIGSKKVCGDRLCSELTTNDPTYTSPEFIQACNDNGGTLKDQFLNPEEHPKYCDFPDKACVYSQYLEDKCVNIFENATEKTTQGSDISLGSDRDEFGCIPSAGYSWSEKEQQCLRPWENPEAFDYVQDNPEDEKSEASYLYVMMANSGTFVQKDGRNILTLVGVTPQTIWFTDRPMRDSGHLGTDLIVGLWDRGEGSFAYDPPNAALTILDSTEDSDVIIVELLNPVYSSESESLQFDVVILESATEGLAHYEKYSDATIPDTFGRTSLFIDSDSDLTIRLAKIALGSFSEGVVSGVGQATGVAIFGAIFGNDDGNESRQIINAIRNLEVTLSKKIDASFDDHDLKDAHDLVNSWARYEIPSYMNMKDRNYTNKELSDDLKSRWLTKNFQTKVVEGLSTSGKRYEDLKINGFPTYWMGALTWISYLQELATLDTKSEDPNQSTYAADIRNIVLPDMDKRLKDVINSIQKQRVAKISDIGSEDRSKHFSGTTSLDRFGFSKSYKNYYFKDGGHKVYQENECFLPPIPACQRDSSNPTARINVERVRSEYIADKKLEIEKSFEHYTKSLECLKSLNDDISQTPPIPVDEFVKKLYNEILLREPSDKEVDYWINEIKNGESRGTVVFDFYNSDEFRNMKSPPEKQSDKHFGVCE